MVCMPDIRTRMCAVERQRHCMHGLSHVLLAAAQATRRQFREGGLERTSGSSEASSLPLR